MKLKKTFLYNRLYEKLKERGYEYFKDSTTGADVLFVKRIGEFFFLSLGIVISQFYDAKFSASFYLSKTTNWSALWGDIPKESYRRIGAFLEDDERRRLLDSEHSAKGVIDAWWGITNIEVENFLEVVGIAEERFLQQKDLFKKIEDSNEVKELATASSLVLLAIEKNTINEGNYDFTPQEKIDGIDLKWFKAAETAIRTTNGILNKNTVKILATDAWRQHYLLNLGSR